MTELEKFFALPFPIHRLFMYHYWMLPIEEKLIRLFEDDPQMQTRTWAEVKADYKSKQEKGK